MIRETHYILEDGSTGDPSEVKLDAAGVLRHKGGMAVAIGPHGPRSRGVDVDENRMKAEPQKDMKPAEPKSGYLTREAQAEGDHDYLAALRSQYVEAFGKRPFPGWDAAVLSEKLAAKGE